jgi:phage gpG-like protein
MGTFIELSGILKDAPNRMQPGAVVALESSAQMIEDEAKRVIGTYDYGWPSLKPETIKRKGADTPLLQSGEMRDSITHQVDEAAMVAVVGTNDPKAKFHELGTVHIPARSFLAGAAMHKEEDIVRLTSDIVISTLFDGVPGTPVPVFTRWLSPLV